MSPRHHATRARTARVRAGGGTGGAALPATIGMQYALWSSGRQRALQRTTRTGIVIAFAGVVGCALFFASLHHFTATRTRYGLDYDFTLELPNDHATAVVDQLARDHSLAAAASVQSGTIEVDGQAVEAYAVASASGAIEPVLHSGRRPASATEVALGPKLMGTLGKHVGDSVRVTSATGRRTLQIVGTAYVPLPESSEFNGGALLTPAGYDANAAPEAVQAVVRVAPGADRHAVLAHLDREYPYGVSDESLPNPPGAVRNLQQISRLPLALLTFFALLGAAALLQALFLTATERRSDLAVLRALGFTRAQSGTVICSAATGIAVVAALIAIPVGVIAGRIGWTAVTRNLFVAPGVVVPVWGLLVAAAALVVAANVAALYPVRALTRHTAGATLRAE